jgi:hypothetical protein
VIGKKGVIIYHGGKRILEMMFVVLIWDQFLYGLKKIIRKLADWTNLNVAKGKENRHIK